MKTLPILFTAPFALATALATVSACVPADYCHEADAHCNAGAALLYQARENSDEEDRVEKILFRSNTSGNMEIYAMDLSDRAATNISQTGSDNEQHPGWSSDGESIYYVTNRDGNNQIYRTAADGSNPVNLSNNAAQEYLPDENPIDGRIAFTSGRDGNEEIYIMDADGSNATRLTNHGTIDTQPAWSPDGTRISWVANRDGNKEIYVMDADGSNQTRLTNNAANDLQPSWSPDGARILFTSDRDGGTKKLYTIRPDGTNVQQFYSFESLQGTLFGDGRVLYRSDAGGDSDLFLGDEYGNVLDRITTDTSDETMPDLFVSD